MAKLTNLLTTFFRRRVVLRLALLALAFAAGGSCRAAQPEQIERQVKAAYLYKFGSYVEWPEQAFAGRNTPVTIAVAGADALADELAQVVAQRTIAGRPVAVRKLQRDDPVDTPNILYIGRVEAGRATELLSQVKGKPVLTVTDSSDVYAMGGMINFKLVDDHVRFEVAPDTAERGGLKISSRMLSVAYQVAGRKP